MTQTNWETKRDLRIELLKLSDQVQMLSIIFRDRGLSVEHASDLVGLQIKVGELIGKLLMTEK
jgi:hypothetical protein